MNYLIKEDFSENKCYCNEKGLLEIANAQTEVFDFTDVNEALAYLRDELGFDIQELDLCIEFGKNKVEIWE